MSDNFSSLNTNIHVNQPVKSSKKTSKKVSYSTLKDFEIETDILNKILSNQAKENKKNILAGGREITVKELINQYLRKGLEM